MLEWSPETGGPYHGKATGWDVELLQQGWLSQVVRRGEEMLEWSPETGGPHHGKATG